MNIKRILVATDFSSTANSALRYAAGLAECMGAQVDILHAFTVPVLTVRGRHVLPDPRDVATNKKIAEAQLEETKTLVVGKFNVNFSFNTILIDLPIHLSEVIHRRKADLIVIGATGGSAWKKIFVGSNAARIIQNSPIPVLAIPEGAQLSPLNKIGLAYDGLKLKEINKLSIIKSFQKIQNGSIHIFRVLVDKKIQSPFISDLMNFLPGAEYTDTYESDVESGILKHIRLKKLDMMAIIPRQSGFFHNLIKGSVTDRITSEISIPLLAIPE